MLNTQTISSPEYFCFQTEYKRKILRMNSLTHLEYDCNLFAVTMVAILKENSISENKESSFVLKCCHSRKRNLSKLKQHQLHVALSKELFFKCLSVMSYEQFIVSIVELIMLSSQQIL